MRSLLALAIILVFGIDLSAQALTVPRMRKRELPAMWQDDVQPEYVPLIMNQCSFLMIFLSLGRLKKCLMMAWMTMVDMIINGTDIKKRKFVTL